MTSYALFGVLGAIYIYLAYVSLSEPAIAEGKLQRICLGRSPSPLGKSSHLANGTEPEPHAPGGAIAQPAPGGGGSGAPTPPTLGRAVLAKDMLEPARTPRGERERGSGIGVCVPSHEEILTTRSLRSERCPPLRRSQRRRRSASQADDRSTCGVEATRRTPPPQRRSTLARSARGAGAAAARCGLNASRR